MLDGAFFNVWQGSEYACEIEASTRTNLVVYKEVYLHKFASSIIAVNLRYMKCINKMNVVHVSFNRE